MFGIVGALVIVFLAALAIPFFIDVDAMVRPEIQKSIEENLNAKAEIGKLRLSFLWGINIGVDSLKIIEQSNKQVFFEMKNAKIAIPFLSFLSGKLSVKISADNPNLNLVRNKEGILNISTLMRPSGSEPQGKSSVGGVVVAGRIAISTEITNANISFKDQKMGYDYKINRLNFSAQNVGLGHPFDMKVTANLSVDDKKDISLIGKVVFEGSTQINTNMAGLENVKFKSNLDLSDLEIKYGALFKKEKNVPLNISMDINSTKSSVEMNLVELNANNFKIKTKGNIEDFDNPKFNISVSSNELKLDDWKKIIKPLGEFDLDGEASFNFNLKGSLAKPEYSGQFNLNKGSMKIPGVGPRATQILAEMNIETNALDLKNASMVLGNSDMSLKGKVDNFTSPDVNILFVSKKLDLDELLPKSQQEQESKPTAEKPDLGKSLESPIAKIRGNTILRKTHLKADTKINNLIIKGADISDIKATATFKDLIFTMENASLKVFKGMGKASFKIDLKEKKPAYTFAAEIQNLDTNSAVVSQFKDMDKTLTGLANAKFEIKGAGVSMEDLNKFLTGKGNLNVQNGTWSGLAALKMIGEKLKSIPKAGEAAANIKISDKFRALRSDFNIHAGKFNVVNAVMDMEGANTSVNMNGFVAFTKDMNMKGDIYAPITNIPKKLKASDGRGKIPFEVEGKVMSPQVNWGATIGPVTTAYAEQEGEKLIQKGVQDLKKSIQNEDVKKLLDNIKF